MCVAGVVLCNRAVRPTHPRRAADPVLATKPTQRRHCPLTSTPHPVLLWPPPKNV